MERFTQLEDFTLFLFLHLALVDGSLHPNERQTILEKMNELFPGNSGESKLDEYLAYRTKIGTDPAEELLEENWPAFAAIESTQKARLFSILFDITNSDARVHEEETRALRLIRKWLTV